MAMQQVSIIKPDFFSIGSEIRGFGIYEFGRTLEHLGVSVRTHNNRGLEIWEPMSSDYDPNSADRVGVKATRHAVGWTPQFVDELVPVKVLMAIDGMTSGGNRVILAIARTIPNPMDERSSGQATLVLRPFTYAGSQDESRGDVNNEILKDFVDSLAGMEYALVHKDPRSSAQLPYARNLLYGSAGNGRNIRTHAIASMTVGRLESLDGKYTFDVANHVDRVGFSGMSQPAALPMPTCDPFKMLSPEEVEYIKGLWAGDHKGKGADDGQNTGVETSMEEPYAILAG